MIRFYHYLPKAGLLALLIMLMGVSSSSLQAQCSFNNNQFGTSAAPTIPNTPVTLSNCLFGGEHRVVTGLQAGSTYRFETCGDNNFDTQITIFNQGGGSALAYNDDFCGFQSSVDFIPTITGNYAVQINEWPCQSNSSCMTLRVTLVEDIPCEDNEVSLTINTDDFGSETFWNIEDENGSEVAGVSSGTYSSGTTTVEDLCLPDGCYTLNMQDSFGDGMCCTFGSGSYSLEDADGNELASGGEFGSIESTPFCLGDLCDIEITGTGSTPETCPGDSDGSISVSASCSSCSGIEYSVGGSFQGSGTFGNLSAGTYNVTARDAGDPSCIASTTVVVGAGTGGAILSPWVSYDVGSSGTLGNDFSQNPCDGNGTFTIDAGGNNGVTSTSDAVGFVGQTICGDGSITVKIESVSQYGQGGPMIRESGAAGAKQASMFGNLTSIIRWEHRAANNSPKTVQAYPKPNPFWLRLVRQGDWIFGYYSTTGANFSYVHGAYVPMSTCVQFGMASFSSVPFAQGTTVFSNVSITGGNAPTAETPGVEAAAMTRNQARLFPNPAQSQVTVDFAPHAELPTFLTLRNELGQVVEERQLEPQAMRTEWAISSLVNGVYFVEIRRDGEVPQVLRFVKTN